MLSEFLKVLHSLDVFQWDQNPTCMSNSPVPCLSRKNHFDFSRVQGECMRHMGRNVFVSVCVCVHTCVYMSAHAHTHTHTHSRNKRHEYHFA